MHNRNTGKFLYPGNVLNYHFPLLLLRFLKEVHTKQAFRSEEVRRKTEIWEAF